MNVLWRIIWKEYRAQRTLWLTILGTAVALQFFFVLATGGTGPGIGPYGAALTFPTLYALACSAVLFAAEREEETRELLRHLAAPAGRLLAGKVGFAVASTGLMLLLLWLLAAVLSRELSPAQQFYDMKLEVWQVGALLCVEVLLWGLCFSLSMQRVLNAVCVTAAVAAGMHYFYPYNYYVLPALLVVDVWLARRWLAERLIPGAVAWHSWRRGARPAMDRISAHKRDAYATEATPAWRRPIQRLIWQEWRQARAFLGVALAAGVALMTLSGYIASRSRFDYGHAVLLLAPLVFGLWTFQSEQAGRRFRFLAERGIAPQAVWLSKHVVWLTATVIVSLALALTFWISASVWQPSALEVDWHVSGILMYVALSYSVGQFLSLLLPRAVTAVFIGLVLNSLSAAWLFFMVYLQVPLVWSVGTIPLVLMAATLLRSHDWMLERNSVRGWLQLTSGLLAAALLLVAGVAAYRVWEVPWRGPGFDVADPSQRATADEAPTAELYRQATDSLVYPLGLKNRTDPKLLAQDGWPNTPPEEREWLAVNPRTIELLLAATSQPVGVFAARGDAESYLQVKFFAPHSLGKLLLVSARQLEAEGKLDEALDRYVAALRLAKHAAHRGSLSPWLAGNLLQQETYQWLPRWAADPQQEPLKIAAAMRRIDQETRDFPPASEAVKVEYAVAQEIMSLDLASQVRIRLGKSNPQTELFILERIAPWEWTRARRVLDALVAENLGMLAQFEPLFARPGTDLLTLHESTFADDGPFKRRTEAWIQTTPGLLHRGAFHIDSLIWTRIDTQTHRSACLLTLALLKWRLEKGELPQRLDELGSYALQYALDPWSGQMFGYLPQAKSHELKFANAKTFGPALWSVGAGGARVIPIGELELGVLQYRVVPGRAGARMLPTSPGVGLAFPIP